MLMLLRRHKTRTVQVLQTRTMSSRQCLPLLPHHGSHVAPSPLQVLHEGTTPRQRPMLRYADHGQGNCKFGVKCALAHYLPNGVRVSKADLEPLNARHTMQYGINGRDAPHQYPHNNSVLNEPFPPAPANAPYFPDIPFLDDEYDPNPERPTSTWNTNGRAYEQPPVGSPPTSQFGSPPNDALSPPRKWPSALNAPLPASYNNSVPHYAKFGPFGSSVPDKFGLGSPSTLTQSQKTTKPAVRDRDTALRGAAPASTLNTTPLGASPAQAETSIGERIMHSARHAPKSRAPMSASVPVNDHFEDRFGVDNDLPFLPSDLHEEVLTPGEKMRRLSRPDRSEQDISGSFKDIAEGLAIPRRSSNVVGSPPAAGSPSRFRAIFEEQQREKTSNVGVVGSPLRESWMLDGNSTISHRQSVQMSGISQAMARVELGRTESTESNGLRTNGLRGGYARQVSSPGLSSKRIDEEGEPAFFAMDDESTRRANPTWYDGQKESSPQNRGVAIKNGNRPVFGYQG